MEDIFGSLLAADDKHAAILVQDGLQRSLGVDDVLDPATARLTHEALEVRALVLVDEGESQLGVDSRFLVGLTETNNQV